MDKRDFLGRGVKFPLQIDPTTGKLAMSGHEEDIRESIYIILNTSCGERIMRPDFGTNIIEYAFEPVSDGFTTILCDEVHRQLLYQEPRIEDVNVVCEEIDQSEGKIVFNISYTVRSTNNRYNNVFPFYLSEGSEGGGAK